MHQVLQSTTMVPQSTLIAKMVAIIPAMMEEADERGLTGTRRSMKMSTIMVLQSTLIAKMVAIVPAMMER